MIASHLDAALIIIYSMQFQDTNKVMRTPSGDLRGKKMKKKNLFKSRKMHFFSSENV